MLVTPAGSLDPLQDGLRAAIAEVWSPAGVPEAQEWTLHVSVACSRVSGPADLYEAALDGEDRTADLTLDAVQRLPLTDEDVTGTAARYAPARPPLDAISRRALTASPAVPPDGTEPGGPGQDGPGPAQPQDAADGEDGPEGILQSALSRAPDQGISVSELMAATGIGRRWVYYRLRELSAAGRVIQTARRLWRIAPQGGNRE